MSTSLEWVEVIQQEMKTEYITCPGLIIDLCNMQAYWACITLYITPLQKISTLTHGKGSMIFFFFFKFIPPPPSQRLFPFFFFLVCGTPLHLCKVHPNMYTSLWTKRCAAFGHTVWGCYYINFGREIDLHGTSMGPNPEGFGSNLSRNISPNATKFFTHVLTYVF